MKIRKSIEKLAVVVILVLMASSSNVLAQNAPVTTIGNVITTNSTATVLIKAVNFTGITAIDMQITYDASIATATSVTKGAALSGNMSVNLSTPGVIRFGWFTFAGVTLPANTTIFQINFTRVGFGTSALEFDDPAGYQCEYYDQNFTPLNDSPHSTYWIDGSLTFQGAAKTTLGNVTSCPSASAVAVPVRVSDFINIGSLNLTFNYNPAVLVFQSGANTSGFPSLVVSSPVAGTVNISGSSSSSSGESLPDNTILATVFFTFLGGNSALTWNDVPATACQYTGPPPSYTVLNDIPTSSFYINGSVGCTTVGPSGSPPIGVSGLVGDYINASTPPIGTPTFNPTTAAAGYVDACGGAVTATLTGTSVSGNNAAWTVTYTFKVSDVCGNELTGQTIQHTGTGSLKLALKAYLKGPWNGLTGRMNDQLRAASLIPAAEPYAALGYTHKPPGGSESVSASVFTVTGTNAIVDWVFVELRSSSNPAIVIATRSALLQADGDIVDTDNSSVLNFTGIAPGSYYVAVKHRNHLGVMTSTALALSATGTSINFTLPATGVYGTYPRVQLSTGIMGLWSGNASSGNSQIIYAGTGNDPSTVFNTVINDPGNTSGLPNFILAGYRLTDLNLDGNTIYAGSGNDVTLIFNAITSHPGNTTGLPNFIISQQIP